jgi:uncharacterized PurR-regulated membrane protein YhhQ (DUF165 family)
MTRHLIETGVVALVAFALSYAVSFLLTRRASDQYARHFVRRAVHFLAFLVALIALGFVWTSSPRARVSASASSRRDSHSRCRR